MSKPPVAAIGGIIEMRQRRRISLRACEGRVRNGASASAVTTQGETVVAKFLARNGPSGCASQA